MSALTEQQLTNLAKELEVHKALPTQSHSTVRIVLYNRLPDAGIILNMLNIVEKHAGRIPNHLHRPKVFYPYAEQPNIPVTVLTFVFNKGKKKEVK